MELTPMTTHVVEELLFQDQKWRNGGQQVNSDFDRGRMYIILMEEIGEVAKAIVEHDDDNLYHECIQSIALLYRMAAKAHAFDIYKGG